MATEIESAIANELGFHIDDMTPDHVTDAEARPMGTHYSDTTMQSSDGTLYPPNQFAIVLGNGQRYRVTVEQER